MFYPLSFSSVTPLEHVTHTHTHRHEKIRAVPSCALTIIPLTNSPSSLPFTLSKQNESKTENIQKATAKRNVLT
jgi:hypothetical protein